MPTGPAFQLNAFQTNAFQIIVPVVAAPYSLGSPSFAKPPVVEVISTPSYSLGSPTFDTPVLTEGILTVHASAYSLGSPAYASPALGQLQYVAAPAYSLGSPGFASPAVSLLYFSAINSFSLGSPAFAAPRLGANYVFAQTTYDLAPFDYGTASSIGLVDAACFANSYWLGPLGFTFPLITQTITVVPWPPFYADKLDETQALLADILQHLMATVPTRAPEAYAARRAVGIVLANSRDMLINGTLGAPLRACWDAAVAAGATFDAMDSLRVYCAGLVGKSDMGNLVIRTSVLLSLAEQAAIVAGMTFNSSADVAAITARMGAALESVNLTFADQLPAAVWENMGALAAAVMQHLNITELKLPRVVAYTTAQRMPALAVAYSLYDDTSRFEEVIAGNRVVHPAFMPRELAVLSQ